MSERTDIESTSWLDALPADYLTAELRQTVEKAAADAARRRRNREAAESAEAAIQAAVAAGDDDAAAQAIQRKSALDLLLDRLPGAGYDPVVCNQAVELATAKIAAAQGEIPLLPPLHCDLEIAAFRELNLAADRSVSFPVQLPIDRQASETLAATAAQRASLLKSIDRWRVGAMSLQDRLASAVSLVEQIQAHVAESASARALVDSANAAHSEVAFVIPSRLDSQQPPAVVELLRWRKAVALAASPALAVAS
ncbi:MAG: hypothetical protein WBF51_01680 [Candidatus Dormiibacterota bacterium]